MKSFVTASSPFKWNSNPICCTFCKDPSWSHFGKPFSSLLSISTFKYDIFLFWWPCLDRIFLFLQDNLRMHQRHKQCNQMSPWCLRKSNRLQLQMNRLNIHHFQGVWEDHPYRQIFDHPILNGWNSLVQMYGSVFSNLFIKLLIRKNNWPVGYDILNIVESNISDPD